ncbi:MAG: xanthine dehydrogenase family protein molybdopterin-binding subunit [Burkholderiaceae bacterium]|nr:xanthine dehydrogenase family protein molybdopterin-binding subunit [Burkholderiaceae bacterium]
MKFGIGQSMARVEDQRLLKGTGKFVDDVLPAGAASVVFVRSPYPRARLVSIDASAAKAAPGVIGVVTGADLLAAGVTAFPLVPGLPNAQGEPWSAPPYYPLATDEVRFVGQTVVAIVAETRAQAEAAAELVVVDYDELPSVTTLEAARAPDAPALWPQATGNVFAAMRFGNQQACDDAFAKAAHVAKVSFMNQRILAMSLEPRGTLAEFDAASGRFTVRTSCQNPATLRGALAGSVLNVPPEQVRVVVGDVGGGFGMKSVLYPEDAVCAWAARQFGRAVFWRATRSEEFLAANHGRDQHNEGELALDADGKVLGLRVRIVGNVGAYGSGPGTIIVVAIGPKVITGVYHIPTLDLRSEAVTTNTNLVGAYRGAGRPEAIFLIERLMDQAAADMKLDPAELRRRNFIQPAQMPYTTPMGEQFDSGNFPHMLARMLYLADWKGYAQRQAQSKARGKLRGRAISTFLEWTGVVHEETVSMQVQEDGRVFVFTAMQAMGQGIESSYVQIVSEAMDIEADKVVVVQGDSDVAEGIGSVGSRSLYIGGSAMVTVSKDTIDKARELAADALEASPADLEYADARFTIAGTDRAIGLGELAARQPDKRIAMTTKQTVGGPSWPNSCHVCEVEIDPETGEVCIVKYTTLDDVGRVVNPMIVAGQVHGGIAQAVGQALMEAVHYDPASGQLFTGSLMDYSVPRADNFPRIEQHCDESTPCKINPLGAKGVGELGTVGGTPTVVNAVLDALRPLGIQHLEMPLTSERVWLALQTTRAA